MATFVVYQEGLFPTLCGLTPGPGDIPLLALDSAVEHIVLFVEDASRFKRVVHDIIPDFAPPTLFSNTFHETRDCECCGMKCAREEERR